MKSILSILCLAFSISVYAAEILPYCINGSSMQTKDITHYMIPLLRAYSTSICDTMEGTCIYMKQNVPYMHNYGYTDEPLAQERCKNGYGNRQNCLHPCRTLAASMKYYQPGQIVFIKDLVGKKCGNLQRDGFELVHDGYMMIGDTGSPKYFHSTGRFDFFWGRCQNMKSGECLEGAIPISDATTNTPFCTVWDPSHPEVNRALHDAFLKKVQSEDMERGDPGAAADLAG